MKDRVVFLDRDGVINVEDGNFVTRPEDLRLLPGALESIARLTAAGWTIVIFTNQSGVGRGQMTESALAEVHDSLRAQVTAAGGHLAGIYACIHAPDAGCDCRKPQPGLLIRAAQELKLDLSTAYAAGDTPRDIAAGHSAGCKTALILSGHTKTYSPESFPDPQPDEVFPNISALAEWLISSR